MSVTDKGLAVCAICGGGARHITAGGVIANFCKCGLQDARAAFQKRAALIADWDDVQDELASDYAAEYNVNARHEPDSPRRMTVAGLRRYWEERRARLPNPGDLVLQAGIFPFCVYAITRRGQEYIDAMDRDEPDAVEAVRAAISAAYDSDFHSSGFRDYAIADGADAGQGAGLSEKAALLLACVMFALEDIDRGEERRRDGYLRAGERALLDEVDASIRARDGDSAGVRRASD